MSSIKHSVQKLLTQDNDTGSDYGIKKDIAFPLNSNEGENLTE